MSTFRGKPTIEKVQPLQGAVYNLLFTVLTSQLENLKLSEEKKTTEQGNSLVISASHR